MSIIPGNDKTKERAKKNIYIILSWGNADWLYPPLVARSTLLLTCVGGHIVQQTPEVYYSCSKIRHNDVDRRSKLIRYVARNVSS